MFQHVPNGEPAKARRPLAKRPGSTQYAIQVEQCSRQVAVKPACRKLTPNIHSSHNLNRPEAKRFRVKLANLKIPKYTL
jgi:hypothetical protein